LRILDFTKILPFVLIAKFLYQHNTFYITTNIKEKRASIGAVISKEDG
jgi:hypothetical protein